MTPKARTQIARAVPKRKFTPPKFLHILLDVERHRISIVRDRAVVAQQPPIRPMAPPKMDTQNWEKFQLGSSEIVMAFYAADRSLLDTVAEAAVPHYFVDNLNVGKHTRLKGGLVTPRSDQRLFHVTVPKGTAFIGLFRTEIGRPGPEKMRGVVRIPGRIGQVEAEFRIMPSIFYVLPWADDLDLNGGFRGFDGLDPRGLPGTFPLPVPSRPDIETLIDIAFGIKILKAHNSFWVTRPFESTASPPFTTNESVQPAERSMNIVILGDGFQVAEDPLFVEAANHLSNALLAEEPFQSYKDVINIHVIPKTHMFQSGVSGCPEGSVKNSYYDVYSNFIPVAGVTTSDRYFGMDDTSRAYAVASLFAPLEEIDLIFMIVNCELLGGSAPPNNLKMAYTSLGELKNLPPAVWPMTGSLEQFKKMAVHEAGHVLGGLVDEYITCVPWDPVYADPPNCARRDQMNANLDDPPWLPLIQEETGDPNPQVEVRDIDPGTSCCDAIGPIACIHNNGIMTGSALRELLPQLGVYWGCMYRTMDPGMSTMDNIKQCFPNFPNMDCASSCCKLELARDFFRALAWCKMFSHDFPFCPVCSRELEARIQAKTG